MINKTDRWIITWLIGILLLYLLTWIIGIVTGKAVYLVSWLNMLAGGLLICNWIQKQFRLRQLNFETRECVVLVMEVLIAGIAAHSIFSVWTSPSFPGLLDGFYAYI